MPIERTCSHYEMDAIFRVMLRAAFRTYCSMHTFRAISRAVRSFTNGTPRPSHCPTSRYHSPTCRLYRYCTSFPPFSLFSSLLFPSLSHSTSRLLLFFYSLSPTDNRGVAVEGYEKGNFVGPTVLAGNSVGPGLPAYDEEVFGPVLCVVAVETLEEAIHFVNSCSFGNGALVCYVWCADGRVFFVVVVVSQEFGKI